jgi:hypothetical protein
MTGLATGQDRVNRLFVPPLLLRPDVAVVVAGNDFRMTVDCGFIFKSGSEKSKQVLTRKKQPNLSNVLISSKKSDFDVRNICQKDQIF